MLQPWRRVEKRNRKNSSLRPRTVDRLVLSHFFSHHFLAISGPFLVETFWNLYGLYVWLVSNRCLVHFGSSFAPSFRADSRNCRMIHQTMFFSLYRCQMKADRVKNMAKRKRPRKRRNRILDIFRMAHTFTLLAYGFYNPNQKNDMGCYGCTCLKPSKNWRVTEHI